MGGDQVGERWDPGASDGLRHRHLRWNGSGRTRYMYSAECSAKDKLVATLASRCSAGAVPPYCVHAGSLSVRSHCVLRWRCPCRIQITTDRAGELRDARKMKL